MVGVTDGDTIKVLQNGTQVIIRLASIDCPEKGQPYGLAAKKFTANLVAGKVVKVWPTDTDRYGIVAFVFVGSTDLNKELLKAGLAWHFKKYSRDPELAKLEFEARAKKVGLWAEPNPVATVGMEKDSQRSSLGKTNKSMNSTGGKTTTTVELLITDKGHATAIHDSRLFLCCVPWHPNPIQSDRLGLEKDKAYSLNRH